MITWEKFLRLYQEYCQKELVSWVQRSKGYSRSLSEELQEGGELAVSMTECDSLMHVEAICNYFGAQ